MDGAELPELDRSSIKVPCSGREEAPLQGRGSFLDQRHNSVKLRCMKKDIKITDLREKKGRDWRVLRK